jgi:hypothetical protein
MKRERFWMKTDEGELTLSWNTKQFTNVSVIIWRGMVL